jgi:hypothetical protein
LTGTDETGIPVRLEIKAGTSKSEPGVTPKNDTDLVYTKWSDIQSACGQSRLHGGMHFSMAISAGEDLCTGVVSLIVSRTELLKIGDASGALADRGDTSITVKLEPKKVVKKSRKPKKSKN